MLTVATVHYASDFKKKDKCKHYVFQDSIYTNYLEDEGNAQEAIVSGEE